MTRQKAAVEQQPSANLADEYRNLDDRIVRLPEVCQITGKSAPTIWREVKAGKFPKPRELGARTRGWILGEIRNHNRTLPVVK